MRAAQMFRGGLFAIALTAAVAFGGCTKSVDDAVVLEKEHIAAAEASPTPPAAPSPSPEAQHQPESVQTEIAPDEVAVDSYVIKKNVRGSSKDPRAIAQEQWLIKVETVRDRLRFTIQSDPAHFLKVKAGDRVRVRYKQGKYTGTVWSAQVED